MEQTRIPPQVGKYKVFIIDEVHMLSTAAFNAFLKTLEEPPAHVIFILATTEKHKILPTIISRCQIYDFERMTVQDIVDHLEKVAKQEGISYEPEALSVIAEKADGGMRDALSIFDQTASFAQGNITYAKVIEDLNVLDADNYFRMTDLAFENKVSELIVLFNAIVSKGFDCGNVSAGWAAHIRNVLMAKDEKTLGLIETSDTQRQRYQTQAAKCTVPFLYQALKLLNLCDIHYKQSSNKTLLVELTLIQVAQITQAADDDVPASGRSPKRLKSLFQKLLADSRTTAALQVAATDEAHSAAKPKQENAAPANHSVSTGVQEAAQQPARPKLKLNNIGVTFKNLRKQAETKNESEEITISNKNELAMFTEEELRMEWMMMCNRMPPQMRAMSARMKNMLPKITTHPDVEVVVDNQILLEQMREILGRINATLAKVLHNGNIKLTVRLAEQNEIKPILNRREVFELLSQNNAAFKKLRAQLNLELT